MQRIFYGRPGQQRFPAALSIALHLRPAQVRVNGTQILRQRAGLDQYLDSSDSGADASMAA